MILQEKILLTAHLVACIVWVGSVFMGTFIDWPAAKSSMSKNQFPFRFIIGQGTRVFYSVYFGMIVLWISGLLLLFINPPSNPIQYFILILKFICLFIMSAFTIYGSFTTWKKIQFSTHSEAFEIYNQYMKRATITFSCGIIGAVCTLWYYFN